MDSSHLRRPRNFVFENKFSREDFLATSHWLVSPRMPGPKPGALPLGDDPLHLLSLESLRTLLSWLLGLILRCAFGTIWCLITRATTH